MSLIVDNREPQIIKDSLKGSVSFENLKAGDFEFFDENNQSVLLIERKELDDLLSSLVDGRFDDQKLKLSECVVQNPRPIAFLIEGNHRIHPEIKTIQSVMLTTRFRDGFFVMETSDCSETSALILHILDLVKRKKFEALTDEEQHRRFIASRAAHRGGGGFSRKDEWWKLALSQIDGVGPNAAKAIADSYPTAIDLIRAYESDCRDDKARENLLSAIIPAGKKRKIGPKLSERVWRTVCGIAPQELEKKEPMKKKKEPKKPVKKKTTMTKKPEQCLFLDDD